MESSIAQDTQLYPLGKLDPSKILMSTSWVETHHSGCYMDFGLLIRQGRRRPVRKYR